MQDTWSGKSMALRTCFLGFIGDCQIVDEWKLDFCIRKKAVRKSFSYEVCVCASNTVIRSTSVVEEPNHEPGSVSRLSRSQLKVKLSKTPAFFEKNCTPERARLGPMSKNLQEEECHSGREKAASENRTKICRVDPQIQLWDSKSQLWWSWEKNARIRREEKDCKILLMICVRVAVKMTILAFLRPLSTFLLIINFPPKFWISRIKIIL